MKPFLPTPEVPLEVQIREAAYFRWLDHGCPIGNDWAHWFAAEQKLAVALPATEHADHARSAPSFPFPLSPGLGTGPSLHVHATSKIRDDRPEIRASGAVQRTRARQHGGRNS